MAHEAHGARRALPLVLLLAVAALAGCGREPDPAARGVTLIGIDAGDWAVIDSLTAAGRMPRLAALERQGTAGVNMSFLPLQKSPVIWASMATGLDPRRHGIAGFLSADGRRLADSSDWRAPAVWDIAGAAGRTSCVIGWWATYPARDIAGVMVSNFWSYTPAGARPADGMVRPDSLRAALAALVVPVAAVGDDTLARFVDLDRLARSGHDHTEDLAELRAVIAGDLTYTRQACWLAEHGRFDLFALYLRGVDVVCHRFWRYMEPDKSPVPLDADAIAALRRVVPEYYVFTDSLVGAVLDRFPPERQVIVVSDHGFHGPRHRKRGWTLGTEEHRPQGIFLVRSPLYAAGHRFERMEILDVTPTLLALLGLPASAEMPGHILRAGLTGGGQRLVERLEKHRVASYAPLAPARADSAAADTAGHGVDAALKRQLRSLGYIH